MSSVHFRGSTGFTRGFINADDHEMGGKMHDDLLDAVGWAVDRRSSDPARVAIMGASYGGHASDNRGEDTGDSRNDD